MNFPKTQTDISQLAYRMYHGFLYHSGDFPNVSRTPLYLKRLSFIIANKNFNNAVAVERVVTKTKQESLATLKQIMKSCLKKATVDTAANPEKLVEIGWSPKASPQSPCLPKTPRDLTIEAGERATVKLSWQRPADGGSIRNYIIESRYAGEDGRLSGWRIVTISYKREIVLDRQPTGVMLEYRVKAANITGTGPASNTATVTC